MTSLDDAQQTALERSLYDVLHASRGRAHLLRRMAERTRAADRRQLLGKAAIKHDEDSGLIERIVLEGQSA